VPTMPRLMVVVAAAAAAVTVAAAAPVGWQPQLQLCEDVSSCDAWAAATPHAISVGSSPPPRFHCPALLAS
jgi:hypothetical protein